MWIMAGLLLAAALLMASADAPAHSGASLRPPGPIPERPRVDIPEAWRIHNWAPHGSGSCVHASIVMLFNWQDRPDLGAAWRGAYHSGETFAGAASKLDGAGVAWAGTADPSDVAFLEWALRTRRGVAVTVMQARHCVLLVHLDQQSAGILDNNAPGRIRWVTREAFLREWRSGPVTWAITPCFAPPPRLPYVREVS